MARILLGVSGGIAAYKALELVRLATGAGHARARRADARQPAVRRRALVRRAQRRAGAGQRVRARPRARRVPRPAAADARAAQPPRARRATPTCYLIAPASANTIAKLAAGLADNLLSSCALAARCPLVLAPAMNNRMYEHAATQANLRTLRERGAHRRRAGRRAARLQGRARRRAPGRARAQLLAACAGARGAAAQPARGAAHADAARSRGLQVLVTAGGTREPIDSVRFIGNSSSGRMGFALAQAAQRARRAR